MAERDYDAVWNAVYGAAFVDQWRAAMTSLEQHPRRGVYAFDRALEGCEEPARHIANEAVRQLREHDAEVPRG